MKYLVIAIIGAVVIAFAWWLGDREVSEAQRSRRKLIAFVVSVTFSTWVFWSSAGPLVGGLFVIFSPIIIIVAGLSGFLFRKVSKDALRMYGIGVLTFILATATLFPLSDLVKRIPFPKVERVLYEYEVEVETPEKFRRARGECKGKDYTNWSMEDFTLDLGNGRLLSVSLSDNKKGFRSRKGVFNKKNRPGEPSKDRDLQPIQRLTFMGTHNGTSRLIEPHEFEDFFGPGYRYRRVRLIPAKD